MQTMSTMPAANPIMYPLFSAEEVVFVEESLKAFRAKPADQAVPSAPLPIAPHATPVPTKEEWKGMTKAQKLALIEMNWDLPSLREFKQWAVDNATVLAAMDMCAAAPGTWVTFKAACAATKMDYYPARGQLQALTKKRDLMGKGTWPMLADANPPGKIGLAYQMSQAVADMWKQVRSEP